MSYLGKSPERVTEVKFNFPASGYRVEYIPTDAYPEPVVKMVDTSVFRYKEL